MSEVSGLERERFAIGSMLTFQQRDSILVRIQHDEAWGGGRQDILIPERALTVTFALTGSDEEHPNRRILHGTSLEATLPSFLSLALDGAPTGDNLFSMNADMASTGWLDVKTGEFEVHLYLRFFNAIFMSTPALVQAEAVGTYDFSAGKARITNLGEEGAVVGTAGGPELW